MAAPVWVLVALCACLLVQALTTVTAVLLQYGVLRLQGGKPEVQWKYLQRLAPCMLMQEQACAVAVWCYLVGLTAEDSTVDQAPA